jgi:hypothetical protein
MIYHGPAPRVTETPAVSALATQPAAAGPGRAARLEGRVPECLKAEVPGERHAHHQPRGGAAGAIREVDGGGVRHLPTLYLLRQLQAGACTAGEGGGGGARQQ